MRALKTVVGSLLLTGLVWLAFSWPLPRYLADGIPSSSANVEKDHVRRMIPGDHLQMLYSYWLFADMLAGKTPWGCNLYEFNTGADAERRGGGSYADAPFSLVYSLIVGIGNRAVGWNLTGLIALWLTHLFTWLLLRSYLKSNLAAALLALIAVAFPYRWAMLCGGSPTGFAMAWPPLLLWGLDAAIRRFSFLGGCGAALALLFAYWNDGHIFFFSVLLIPAWCLLTVLHSEHLSWKRFQTWRKVVLALSPLLALTLVVVLAGLFKHATQFTDTTMAGGRSWREVALYSFPAAALLAGRGVTPGSPVYIGVILPLALAIGLVLQVIFLIRRPQAHWRAALVFLLLLLGIGIILLLALGTRGPWDGQGLEWARRWIPPYRMIRQPAKIMTILPPLLAVAAALSLTQFSAGVAAILSAARRRAQAGGDNSIDILELGHNDAARDPAKPQGLRWTGCDLHLEDRPILVSRPDSPRGRDPERGQRLTGFMALFCVLVLADYGWQINPTICRLDRSQAAYAVAAEDARAQNRAPRILVLPIWPGDSAWASLYEYYVSLYRIRMINGYQPVVPRRYIEQIFQPLENFNCGIVTDEQLDGLARRGIEHVLLHEDAFPEKVSYFPVAFTLQRLLNHPRLELICQAHNVWAFKILPEPRTPAPVRPDWTVFFPNLFWEMEWLAPADRTPVADASASGGQLVRLDAPGLILTAKPFEHLNAPDPFLLLRCRGQGQLAVTWRRDDGLCRTQAVDVVSARWQWTAVPLGDFGNSRRIQPELAWVSGTVDADLMLYSSGKLPDLKPGESVSLPAPLFFHAGYTDLNNNSVRLRPEYDPADRIFYGPKLPLPDGRYQVQLDYATPAPAGVILGSFRVEIGDQAGDLTPLAAGRPAIAEFSTVNNNLPVTLGFFYARTADLELRQVIFTRVE